MPVSDTVDAFGVLPIIFYFLFIFCSPVVRRYCTTRFHYYNVIVEGQNGAVWRGGRRQLTPIRLILKYELFFFFFFFFPPGVYKPRSKGFSCTAELVKRFPRRPAFARDRCGNGRGCFERRARRYRPRTAAP